MDSNNTLNHWEKQLEERLSKSDFLTCSVSEKRFLQIVNGDYLSVFNNLVKGQKYLLAELDSVSSMNNAMAKYLEEHKDQNIIFTKFDKNKQRSVLETIIKTNDESLKKYNYLTTYLTFGMISYHLEGSSYQAPLVFLPIKISYNELLGLYEISAIKGEILLNDALRMHLKKNKNIDLSYDLNSSFSLSEYIYYVMVKVRPINWIVNNFNYIGNFDFSIFYDYKNVILNKEEIAKKDIVKSLSYFNSEFFRFNHQGDKPLDIKYLSLLEMDNEEYNLLKTISLKENYLLRTYSETSTYHLINNIIIQYLMNDQKILVVYNTEDQEEKILKALEDDNLSKYALNLNPLKINKENEVAKLISYNDYVIPYNSLHPVMIDNDVTSYYSYKNAYKNLVNGLRSTRNPTRTSVNKLINNYYALEKYPLINSAIRGASTFDIDQIKYYMELIKQFQEVYKKLGCVLEDHPFYGFNRKTMVQADYLPLKDSSLKLSSILNEALKLYDESSKKFNLPEIHNLKEMKALLNLLTFAEYYEPYSTDWLDINDLDTLYDDIKKSKSNLDNNLISYIELEKIYGENIRNIPDELIEETKSEKPKKACKKIRKILKMKNLPDDEVVYACREVQRLNEIQINLEEIQNSFPSSFNEYLSTHTVEELRDIIDHINMAKYHLDYLKVKDFSFLKPLIDEGKLIRSSTRQKMQILFNEVLENTEELQSYLDKRIINFDTLSLDEYVKRVDKINLAFASINNYLDYLVIRKKISKISPSLASEFEKIKDLENIDTIFLKRYYYDCIKETLQKDVFLDFTRKGLVSQLERFQDSDNKRRELIDKIIRNNFNKKLRSKLNDIKKKDGSRGEIILEEKPSLYPLEEFIDDFKISLESFRPCILMPLKEVSRLLGETDFKFDNVIIFANRDNDLLDALPSLIKGSRAFVIDNMKITNDPRSKIMNNLKPSSLIEMAHSTYHEIEYTSTYEKEEVIYLNNNYDLDFKVYLMNKLKERHFDVGINRTYEGRTIDLLVRMSSSPTSVALYVDHLPYPSPEIANKSQLNQDAFAYAHNYYPYRVYPAIYFSNEEEEFEKLCTFILEKSHLVPDAKVHKKSILLMNYLFDEYQDPRMIYSYLSGRDLAQKVKDFLVQACPILTKDLKKIFKENIEPILYTLSNQKFIIEVDNFTYVANQPVKFKRLDRDKDFYRPLKSVSKYEIQDAVLKIINHEGALEKETVQKMILLSLGYKKANIADYKLIGDEIEYLIKEKKIVSDGPYLTKIKK